MPVDSPVQPDPQPGPIRLVLGRGASGSAATMRPHVEGLRTRGIDARAIDLPRGLAERAVPRFADLLAAGPDLAVGGHSFGGRVASLAAVEHPARALVLLSYPLHAPGRPETAEARTAHFPAIGCPVLLLAGEADPFARLDLLRAVVARLPNGALVTCPHLGHGLGLVLDDALDRIAVFLREPAGRG